LKELKENNLDRKVDWSGLLQKEFLSGGFREKVKDDRADSWAGFPPRIRKRK